MNSASPHHPRFLHASSLLLLLWCFSLSVPNVADAQDSGGSLSSQQSAYDVTFYDLSVDLDVDAQSIEGRLTTHAVVQRPMQSLVLNLDRRLSVRRATPVSDSSVTLAVERRDAGYGGEGADSNEVWIALPEVARPGDTVRVSVEYGGSPRVAPQPPWDGGFTWSTTPGGAPWVATSCQTEGADLWWPVKDHPSDEPDSMHVAVTVPDSLAAASNGRFAGREVASEGRATYRWRVTTPINAYAVALNVAPYTVLRDSFESTAGERVPVSLYALPSDSSKAAASLPKFVDQVQFLEKQLGPYPFRADKYGVAQTPFLGMEHQTIIAYGHTYSDGGLGYLAEFDALHFHELVHEWYGNCVTVQDWKDFWIHEGTATYFEALYAEALGTDEDYHRMTDYFRSRVRNRQPVAFASPKTAQDMYGTDVYFKGASMLHTLRYVIGEDALRTLLRRFMEGEEDGNPSCRHVTTADFVSLAEEVSGRQLDGFFSVYLYRTEPPRLQVDRTETAVRLSWGETGGMPFDVPVPVRVDGETQRVEMTDGMAEVDVPPNASVEVDPMNWILKR